MKKVITVPNYDISSQLHSLRVYFSATKIKVDQAHEIPKVKWPFYEKLFFLSDITPRNTVSNLGQSSETIDTEDHSSKSPA